MKPQLSLESMFVNGLDNIIDQEGSIEDYAAQLELVSGMTQFENQISTFTDDLILQDFGFLKSFEDESQLNIASKQSSAIEAKESKSESKTNLDDDLDLICDENPQKIRLESEKNRLNCFEKEGRLREDVNTFCSIMARHSHPKKSQNNLCRLPNVPEGSLWPNVLVDSSAQFLL